MAPDGVSSPNNIIADLRIPSRTDSTAVSEEQPGSLESLSKGSIKFEEWPLNTKCYWPFCNWQTKWKGKVKSFWEKRSTLNLTFSRSELQFWTLLSKTQSAMMSWKKLFRFCTESILTWEPWVFSRSRRIWDGSWPAPDWIWSFPPTQSWTRMVQVPRKKTLKSRRRPITRMNTKASRGSSPPTSRMLTLNTARRKNSSPRKIVLFSKKIKAGGLTISTTAGTMSFSEASMPVK